MLLFVGIISFGIIMVIKVFTTDYVEPGDIDIKSPESFISVVSSVPAILLAYGF